MNTWRIKVGSKKSIIMFFFVDLSRKHVKKERRKYLINEFYRGAYIHKQIY